LQNGGEKVFQINPAEASDVIAHILQAGVLNFPNFVDNSVYVSIVGGGVRKMLSFSTEECGFQIEVNLEGLNKTVTFQDTAAVPKWLKEEFHNILRRMEELTNRPTGRRGGIGS
jgi:hypothetical protein